MRTEKRWKETIQQKVINRLFSPRLAKDLKVLKLSPVYENESRYFYSSGKETGKTVYACRMLLGFEKKAYLTSTPISTSFLPVVDLTNELKHSFDTAGESEIDILRKYQTVDVLVLDDLGTNKMSDWMYHVLYSLINYRYENLKITLITSNHSLVDLEQAWGDDRITSRIQRMCRIVKKEKYEE